MRSASPFLLALVLFVLPLTPTAAAQDDGAPPEALREDAWALQFGIGQNFRLSSFQGATVSFKRHTSAEHAWQIGLTLAGALEDGRIERGDGRQEGDDDQNSASLRLVAHYLSYPLLEEGLGDLQLFAGAGPLVSYSRFSEVYRSRERERSRFSVGASGLLGAEWFVKERISLSASYQSALTYRRSTGEVSNRDDPARSEDRSSYGFGLDTLGVNFGVSVYF